LESLLKYESFENKHQKKLKKAFNQDIKIITDVFGHHFLSPITTVKVESEDINQLIYSLEEIIENNNIGLETLNEILDSVKHMKDQSFFNMLEIHQITVKNIANKLNKDLFPLEIIGSQKLLVGEKFKSFTQSLIHIFRNSIVHGIESPEIRNKYHKNSKGKLRCIFDCVENDIVLQLVDDGQGINPVEIINKAIELNLTTKEIVETLSDEEVLQFIFSTEFSTNDYADEFSGRGVGLASVKYELEKLNGTVQIDNNQFEGLSFIFTLPYKDDTENDALFLSDIVSKRVESFFVDDVKIKSNSIVSISKFTKKNYSTSIQLSGLKDVLFTISVNKELVDKVLSFFLQNTQEEDQNLEEVRNSVVDEMINIFVGLAIQNFSHPYNSLTLGTPLLLDNTIIETFITHNQSSLLKIETDHGGLELAVIILNKMN